MAKFGLLPMPSSHHHRDRQPVRRARHRYQTHLMAHPGLDGRSHRRRARAAVESPDAMYARVTKDMLRLHNHHRARHCAAPLTIDERLNGIAQGYAEYLASTSTFEHSGNKLGSENLGENLYMQWISSGPVKVSTSAAVKSWYDEIALHDFDRPQYSSETGHFTQMVWKATRKLGVGVALSPDGREVYMVTNYYPAGNIMGPGYFEKNVLRPKC